MGIGNFGPVVYDYLVNRVRGVYIGKKPKNPNNLVIPQFISIQNTTSHTIDILTSQVAHELLQFPLIVCDQNTWEIAGKGLFDGLLSMGITPKKYIAQSNAYAEVIEAVQSHTRKPRFWKHPKQHIGNQIYAKKEISIIIPVGGGMIIDFGKLMAKIMNVPFVSIPTSLANDGIASPFAVINPAGYSSDSINLSMQTFTPLGVIINIDSIKYGSKGVSSTFLPQMVRSGIGDVLSNITACLDWRLAFNSGKADMDYLALLQSSSAGETILAKIKQFDDILDDDFLMHLAAALAASGESMTRVSSSRPASGFEHKFYHAFNHLYSDTIPQSHGLLVAIGTLISSKAHDKYFDELRAAFEKVGLPTTMDDLAALSITEASVVAAIQAADAIKPERYTILEHIGSGQMIDFFRKTFSAS